MAAVSLTDEVTAQIQALVDNACSGETDALPYASAVVVGRGTGELFAHSSGNTVRGHNKITTADTQATVSEKPGDDILWLASCTKLVTSIACLQLVEQGKLFLDDADQVESTCPELRDVKVVQDDGSLVDKSRRITLRMLLTHTAGFGYPFLNSKLAKYRRLCGEASNYDVLPGRFEDMLQPLVNQPGEKFEYSISMDWAGVLIERVTGTRLNDYMQDHIFQPLGGRDLSIIPSPTMRERLVGIWQHSADGRLSRREYPLSRPLDPSSTAYCFQSGGAGLFGSIREYAKILSALLNDGTSLETGASILSPATVSQLFTNQFPDWPNFARGHFPSADLELVYPAEEYYPLCQSSLPQGWSLGFMISPGPTGRSDGTGHWSGISNIFWWADREKGVAGVVASQLLPFVHPRLAGLWVEVEGKVYDGLRTRER